jgi:hypothetical protein
MAAIEASHEAPTDQVDVAPGTLVEETDAAMVRFRDRRLDGTPIEGDWHKVKLCLVGGWQGQYPRCPARHRRGCPGSGDQAQTGLLDIVLPADTKVRPGG